MDAGNFTEEEAMNRATRDARQRFEVICLCVLLAALPLCGCASNRSAAATRNVPYQPPTAAVPHAGPAEVPLASNDAKDFHRPPYASMRPQGDGPTVSNEQVSAPQLPAMPARPMAEVPAAVNVSSSPPQPSEPMVRLASQESPLPAAQPAVPPVVDPRLQLVGFERRPVGAAMARSVSHANATTFEQQVLRSDVPVLVDFYAGWCGPCKKLAPALQELAEESPQAKVVKVNIDDSPELATRYGVKSIPSLMVFKDGQVVAKQQGVVGKARLKAMLDL
jgi:thioredoxin 1